METTFLREILSDSQVTATGSARTEHSHDWGTPAADGTHPEVVVWPESTAEVAAVLAAATERSIPVTPYAAGTSTQGNPIPAQGGISMDLSQMDAITAVNPDALQVRVQPGVIGEELNTELADHGLFFPSLPASADTATLGGMIANDASGMRTVKYGEVGDRVLGLEAVQADGTIIETGSQALKSSSGYNLTDLLVGSEGTLAVITEATLKLAPIPDWRYGGRVIFEDRVAASRAITDTMQAGIDVAKIELVDSLCAAMVNAYREAELPDAPMVFVEFHGRHPRTAAIETFREIVTKHGAVQVDLSEAGPELERLWAHRSQIAQALEPYDPELTPTALGDVAVPIDRFADLIGEIETIAADNDLLIPCFGHAGDGNVHYAIMARVDDPDHREICAQASKRIVRRAVDLGGTATGEHGIGAGKRTAINHEFTPPVIDLMRGVKQQFDPAGILNPGKITPEKASKS